ncbi:MAG: exopolysaccharide biosynthesis protein [Acidobacteriia bacterium]|nr:exopolysaccharide biosynthesis protein [Terriglobia bacterium]
MIDIHSHVLFGMDDGARTMEDSLAMVRMAAEHGTTDLVATPHANLQFKFNPELIAERIAQVREAAAGVLRLYTGCDFHLSYDNIQDSIEHPRKYTINQQRYLLVEFSELLIFKNTEDIFARLRDAGMVPIVTHPERNGLLRQRIENIAKWVDQGARMQITAQSLTSGFGRRAQEFSRELLDRRLVHVVASDGHDCERRPPVMDQARAWLRKKYGDALAEALCVTNPGATLSGADMHLPDADPQSSVRKWYEFWR